MEEMKHSYIYLKTPSVRDALKRWWNLLDDNRGARARLRRVEKPEDAMLTEPFFQFLRQMPEELTQKHLLASSLVASILSHVKEHRGDATFAAQLAEPEPGSDKPRVSELRFQQLQKSHDPEQFFRRLLRAVRLVDGCVNIHSLADSVYHWMKEYRYGVARHPEKRLAVRWAKDYYVTILKNENQRRKAS